MIILLDPGYFIVRQCRSFQFACDGSRRCINKMKVCNGLKECHDGTDEETCGKPEGNLKVFHIFLQS